MYAAIVGIVISQNLAKALHLKSVIVAVQRVSEGFKGGARRSLFNP